MFLLVESPLTVSFAWNVTRQLRAIADSHMLIIALRADGASASLGQPLKDSLHAGGPHSLLVSDDLLTFKYTKLLSSVMPDLRVGYCNGLYRFV